MIARPEPAGAGAFSAPAASSVVSISENAADGGIHGQTNVGHWVRDEETAKKFEAYWEILKADLGGRVGDDKPTVIERNKELRTAVEKILPTPATWPRSPGPSRAR